jgi:hypothetical protein
MLLATIGLVLVLMVLLARGVCCRAHGPLRRAPAQPWLQAQANQMRRLALVAEHTANAVIVAGRRTPGRVGQSEFRGMTGFSAGPRSQGSDARFAAAVAR